MWHNFNKSRENVALFVESYTLFSFWSAIIIWWGLQSFDIFVYIYQKKKTILTIQWKEDIFVLLLIL